jgi:hypothetical protein
MASHGDLHRTASITMDLSTVSCRFMEQSRYGKERAWCPDIPKAAGFGELVKPSLAGLAEQVDTIQSIRHLLIQASRDYL